MGGGRRTPRTRYRPPYGIARLRVRDVGISGTPPHSWPWTSAARDAGRLFSPPVKPPRGGRLSSLWYESRAVSPARVLGFLGSSLQCRVKKGAMMPGKPSVPNYRRPSWRQRQPKNLFVVLPTERSDGWTSCRLAVPFAPVGPPLVDACRPERKQVIIMAKQDVTLFVGQWNFRDFAYSLDEVGAKELVESHWAFGDPSEDEYAVGQSWASAEGEHGWRIVARTVAVRKSA